jgi:hypothetical protein
MMKTRVREEYEETPKRSPNDPRKACRRSRGQDWDIATKLSPEVTSLSRW